MRYTSSLSPRPLRRAFPWPCSLRPVRAHRRRPRRRPTRALGARRARRHWPAAGHRHVRRARAHEGALLGRVRGPPARDVGEELTVAYLVDQFKKVGLKPGNTDGTLRPEGAVGRNHLRPGAARRQERPPGADAQVAGRSRRVDEACRADGEHRRFRAGLCRLRRGRARVQLGRLQGRGREGQDARHARQRSAGRGRVRPGTARREGVRRQER